MTVHPSCTVQCCCISDHDMFDRIACPFRCAKSFAVANKRVQSDNPKRRPPVPFRLGTCTTFRRGSTGGGASTVLDVTLVPTAAAAAVVTATVVTAAPEDTAVGGCCGRRDDAGGGIVVSFIFRCSVSSFMSFVREFVAGRNTRILLLKAHHSV
jgi:hypothetical protein